jgi:hypothetical protein
MRYSIILQVKSVISEDGYLCCAWNVTKAAAFSRMSFKAIDKRYRVKQLF